MEAGKKTRSGWLSGCTPRGSYPSLSGCPLPANTPSTQRGPMKPTVYLNGQFWVSVAAWTTAAGRHALRPVLEPEPHDQEL